MALPADPAEAVQALNDQYEHWLITKTDLGRFWAATTETTLPLGCAAVLQADNPEDLDDLIARQERLRGRSSDASQPRMLRMPLPWAGTVAREFRAGDPS